MKSHIKKTRSSLGAQFAVGVALVVYLAAIGATLQLSYDIAGGVLIAHLAAMLSVPLIFWFTRHEDRRTRRLILVALAAKFVGTIARYIVVFAIYGEGDSRQYDQAGRVLSTMFRHGQFNVDFGGKLIGSGFVELLTGIVYTVVGPTKLGGFFVFSALSFWGTYMFYRAFRLAVPEGDHRKYGLLLFFLPSMVFWPSSVGKEAWVALTLGLLTYGAARLFTHLRGGLLCLVVGTVGTAMVRPHIAILAIASIMAAYLMSSSGRRSYGAALSKMAGVLALVLVFGFAFAAVQNYFKLDEGGSVDDVLTRAETRTTTGGSEFSAPSARSPAELPLAVFSVLFRPLPFEATNPQALITSLEGMVLLGLFVRNHRRLSNFVPRRRAPFLTFAATYGLLFALAFSSIANFGILARQRVQLFPFVLAALAAPAVGRSRRSSGLPEASGPVGSRSRAGRAVGRTAEAPGAVVVSGTGTVTRSSAKAR